MRWVTRPIPRGLVPFWVGIVLDTLDQQPAAMGAVVHGLFFGRIAPSSRERRAIDVPALVVGHPADPIHPAADAAMLAAEMPNATFVKAKSILEWRIAPERLDALAAEFALKAWSRPGGRGGAVPLAERGRMVRCLSTATRRSCSAPTSWGRPTASSPC